MIIIRNNTLYIYRRTLVSSHHQGRLNSLKVVGTQLTNKTHFYCEKLNSYEHLQILWGQVPPVPSWFRRLCSSPLLAQPAHSKYTIYAKKNEPRTLEALT